MKTKSLFIMILLLAGSLMAVNWEEAADSNSVILSGCAHVDPDTLWDINQLDVGPDGYWIPKHMIMDVTDIDSLYTICQARGHVWVDSPYLGIIPGEFGFEPIIEDLPDKSIMIQRHTEQRRRCLRCGLIDFYTPAADTTVIWERDTVHPHIYFNSRSQYVED